MKRFLFPLCAAAMAALVLADVAPRGCGASEGRIPGPMTDDPSDPPVETAPASDPVPAPSE